MEDDGLLLNFTTSSTPANLSSKKLAALQGKKPKGSWRDRRDASRLAAGSREDPLPSFPQPTKSPHGGVNKAVKSSKQPKQQQQSRAQHDTTPKDGIVSSLFTYNPQIMRAEPSNHEDTDGKDATNAPLEESNGFAVNKAMQTFLSEKMNLQAPTQIQKSAIPAINDAVKTHKDVVMVAQTGSGKTLAYLLPILNDLMTQPERINRNSGVFAVILAPTRELATQIFQVCEDICRCCHYIVPGLVIGGEKKKSEKARLRKGVNILIGTPGRMADHVDNTERLSFSKTKYAVLDEGDRLIDLGFEETLTQILDAIPQSRTTVLCSATMNAQASRLKTLALSDPISWVHEQEEQKESHSEFTPGQLIQRIAVVPGKLRLVTLAALCRYINARSKRAIVFFSCTDSVDFHFQVFSTHITGVQVFRLHGSMSQQQRTETIAKFSKSSNQGSGSILFTTDVASRGLDVTVDEVVEYDPPFTIEDHLHRAGRTARAGRKGEACMFLLPSEQEYETKLKEVHPGGLKPVTYQALLQRGFGFSNWQDDATTWQLEVEKAVISNSEGIADLARKAFTSHVRAYTTHSHNEKKIFNFRELHLGHLAKAFALRETPAAISHSGGSGGSGKHGSSSSNNDSKHKKKSPRQAMLDAAQKQLNTDEYNII